MSVEMPDRVWLVWRRFGGKRPCYWHAARELAETEAERLSHLSPGVSFYVMEAVGIVRTEKLAAMPLTTILECEQIGE